MPLSTEGLIEQMRGFRSEKLALVALVGSMGATSEADALRRLREIIRLASKQLVAIRNEPRAERHRRSKEEKLWHDVWELAMEIEPWLAQAARVTDE